MRIRADNQDNKQTTQDDSKVNGQKQVEDQVYQFWTTCQCHEKEVRNNSFICCFHVALEYYQKD